MQILRLAKKKVGGKTSEMNCKMPVARKMKKVSVQLNIYYRLFLIARTGALGES